MKENIKKLKWYKKFGYLEVELNSEDCYDFKDQYVKYNIINPLYYVYQKYDTPFVELFCYKHITNEISIVALWDNSCGLFEFACENEIETLECVKNLLEIALNLIQYERIAKDLLEEEEK